MRSELSAAAISRALLDRRITDGGRPFLVRAPTVGEALIVIATRRGYIAGIEEDRHAFIETVRRWLTPSGLWGRIMPLPPAMIAAYVTAWAFDGVAGQGGADVEKKTEDPERVEKILEDLEAEDFGMMIADYASAFRIDPYSVLSTTPFPMLLAFRGQGIRVRYRDLYEQIIASSIPGADDTPERKASLDQIRSLAGIKTDEEQFRELSREEQDRISREAIKQFEIRFGKFYGTS